MKRILVVFLSIVLILERFPLSVMANDSAKDRAVDIPAYSYSGSKTINKLIHEYRFNSPKGGRGFAAERGNNLVDVIKGKNATIVGDNNIKDGPDRMIIDRSGETIWVQDKYYKTAKQGIDACFKVDEDGLFRYFDAEGNPMRIEVPSDQYEEAVSIMKQKISDGLVPGVTDPEEAVNIIQKGNLSYKQAVNLTKAGNIDSLLYDASTGVITSTCAFGISAVINFSICKMNGMSTKDASMVSLKAGAKTGCQVFAIHMIVSQLGKTAAKDAFVPTSELLVKTFGDEFAEALVNAAGKTTADMSQTAVNNMAIKVLNNQILFAIITVAVLSSGDVVNMFRGRISAKQMAKNMTVTVVGVIGGTSGWIAGAKIGALITSPTGPGMIIGGIVGSLAGGVGGAYITEKAIGQFIKDDTEEMYAIIAEEFKSLCGEYLVSQKEGDTIAKLLSKKLDGDKLMDMYASKDRKEFADNLIEPIIKKQVSKRDKIEMPTQEMMRYNLKTSLQGVVFIH